MNLAHKIELKPNNIQKTYLNKCFGISRFVYNWGLKEWDKQYKEGLKPNGLKLKKEFNSIKKEQFPWITEVTKWTAHQPFINLQHAFTNFFNKKSKYPVFKKKSLDNNSCYIGNNSFRLTDKFLKLPLLKSSIKMTETLRFTGRINSVILSRKGNRYYASFQLDTIVPEVPVDDTSIGIDVGINNLFVTSDKHLIKALNPLNSLIYRLKRYQRKLSKKIKGSNNYLKAKAKLQRLYFRIGNLRKDILHKFTNFLVKTYSIIKIENLNVKGMIKNHNLARYLLDIGINEFVRQLTYKCKMYSRELIFADRFFPSSKICSNCGNICKELTLKNRIYKCDCGLTIDRDLNASININKLGRAPTKIKPVEIAALQNKIFPYFVTSIDEAGI